MINVRCQYECNGNNSEYDYHTLVKVAEMARLAGLAGFHESEDGYIVSFPDDEAD